LVAVGFAKKVTVDAEVGMVLFKGGQVFIPLRPEDRTT